MVDFLEKALLPDMRSGLFTLFQASSLAELESKQTVTLPPYIMQTTLSKVHATLNDHHERNVGFGFTSGEVTTLSENLGTRIEPESLKAASIADESFIDQASHAYKMLFGKPFLIAFHTHPPADLHFFTNSSIKQFTWDLTHDGIKRSVHIPLAAGSQILETQFSFPSSVDVEHLMQNQRHWRSMMIGGKHGYVLLVNPNLHIPFITKPSQLNTYKKDIIIALDDAVTRTSQTGDPDISTMRSDMTTALKNYCDANKIVAFINSDPSQTTLHKI